MDNRRKVILITDGDEYAKKAIECVAKEYGGRCISSSKGNPTVIVGSRNRETDQESQE